MCDKCRSAIDKDTDELELIQDSRRELPKEVVAAGDKLLGKNNWQILEGDEGDDPQSTIFELITYPKDDENGPAEYNRESIASVQLAPFPGCCGIGVLTGLYSNSRQAGYARFLMKAMIQITANQGYTVAVATSVVAESTDKIARAVRAKNAIQFTNRKTDHEVQLWVKQLPKRIGG